MTVEVLESYGNVRLINRGHEKVPEYELTLPQLSEQETNILKNPQLIIKDYRDALGHVDSLITSDDKESYIRKYVAEQLNKRGVAGENQEFMISTIVDKAFMGYGSLGPLMRDDNLEEIMVNGIGAPIFVVHRTYGMCETNLKFEDRKSFDEIIDWLSTYVGREIHETKPLLDAQMPDGSRANIAIPPAAPYGPSITIRKFKKIPYNIVELINIGSLTTELSAFLWLCVEGLGINPINMIISGGAGSGKTTLLNAMAMFIPVTERVITVEDTLELNFSFMNNWVPLEAVPSVLEPVTSKIDMESLLKNSLRMRPDRVIVGEVRGEEAETLMVAMDIGMRGSMGTIHANNARESTLRLMEEPMNVPLRMIPLINLVIVMNRIYDRRKGMIRRATQVSEIAGVEGEVVQMGDIYTWDMNTDVIKRTEFPIMLIDRLAERCNLPKRVIQLEIMRRDKVIQYMVTNNIHDNAEVLRIFQKYHADPKSVLDEIKAKTGKADII
jgi:flagellar protein FlaI